MNEDFLVEKNKVSLKALKTEDSIFHLPSSKSPPYESSLPKSHHGARSTRRP